MKLTIDTEKLADAAQWAMRAVPTSPPTPLLAGLRLQAADDTLTLTGFDYYRCARAGEGCEVAEPGTLLVPGRVLADVVKAFPKSRPTTLALDGTDLALSCGTAHIQLPTLPLDDYPTPPEAPAASGTADAAALADAATRVAAAAATDDTIPVLTGVQFTLTDTTLRLTATDRYAFHVAELPWTPHTTKARGKTRPLTEGTVLVPGDAVRDAARILAATGQSADLALTPSHFAVRVPGRSVTGSTLDGELPNYETLFPTEFTSVITAGTEALTDTLKHLTPLLGKGDPLFLDIAEGQITVRAGTHDKARGRDQVDADLDGTPMTVAFSPHLLLRTLQQIDGPVVQLNLVSPTKAALLHAPDQADCFKGLIMPIRLSS
ncbi:DNA polymerase III subunit beta [Streptomyces sp. NPDC085900]|uniref:DNA polymerase III subunit beta n=1 Tax=Streptomyces sp. NPDC085900 TaxID=3365737 RepID=UPI0037D370C5